MSLATLPMPVGSPYSFAPLHFSARRHFLGKSYEDNELEHRMDEQVVQRQ